MRQLFLEKGKITLKEVCQPVLDSNGLLVEVHYSCISSGTEMATIANAQPLTLFSNIHHKIAKVIESLATHGIDGTKDLIKGKLSGTLSTLGYSCAGQVVAVGNRITRFRVGDFVACAGAGFANHADVIYVPENLAVLVHDAHYLKQASLTTIGSIALQGLRRAQPQLGETICVLGLGLLGQITVQLAQLSGCQVIGIDLMPERLDLARRLGATNVLLADEKNMVKEIGFLTNHYGVDTTIVTAASKSNSIVQQAMEITRKKGKVVIVGDVGLALERSPFYQKEIDFLISCSYGPGRYDTSYELNGIDYPYPYVRWTENRNMESFIELVEKQKINVDSLISGCFDVQQAEQAYAALQEKQGLCMVLSFEESRKKEVMKTSEEIDRTIINRKKSTLRIGFIGAGGFAKVKLMPIISRMKNLKINAIVDPNVSNSINVSRVYGAAKALIDDKELFETDLVDVVVIASPHKFHCQQAIAALAQGKAVFMEKPMVTTFEQYQELYKAISQRPHVPFCVDYNRSFAPFIKKIKQVITKRSSPVMIQYRMNAGFIPKDHWIQTELGAGRIIGEACHIVDLFCYLTDAQPRAVSVEALRPKTDNLFPTDNVSIQISFSDGSVCSLLYTSLGHNELGKERMELFFDSKTIVMDDFLVLQGYGLPASFNERATIQDKGHEELLTQFFNALQQEQFQPPIEVNRLCTVAQLTLVIDQLACAGGGNKEITAI